MGIFYWELGEYHLGYYGDGTTDSLASYLTHRSMVRYELACYVKAAPVPKYGGFLEGLKNIRPL